MSESALNKHLHFMVLVLRFDGIPILFQKTPKLYTLYDIICSISIWMTTVAATMDIFMNANGLEEIMSTLRIAIADTMIALIYGYLRWRVIAIGHLINLAESFSLEDLNAAGPETNSLSTSRWFPRIRKVVLRSIINIIAFHFTYTFIRILTMTPPPLSFNSWYPFDTSVSPVFELILLTQLIGCCIFTTTLCGFCGLFAMLISVICTQLEKLRADILNIKEHRYRSVQLQSAIEDDQEEYEEFENHEPVLHSMQEQISRCVRQHQNILSYIQVMENTLHPIMAVCFLLELVTICLILFSIITSWGKYEEMTQGVVTYSVFVILLSFFCWFGSQLSIQAEQVRDAAYGCDWIGAPISFQRSVAMIITITNKEVVLTAGKFAPINIETLMTMINQSMSYFMFLLEVKDKFIETEHIESN